MERARGWVERCLGTSACRLTALPGGAGARRYWRVQTADGRRAVLMHALAEDARILPPQLRPRLEPPPFVTVTGFLREHGLPVPEILGTDAAGPWVLLEDLGDLHLGDLPLVPRAARLVEAIDLLARVHAIAPCDALPFRRRFDVEWIHFELEHFLAHGVAAERRPQLAPELERLAERVAELPAVLCLRDFQSQNLMIDPRGALRILDYQDALLAPAELDLVALLHDSYIAIARDQRTRLLERYAARRGVRLDPTAFALLTVQRKCKDYGRFCFLLEVKGDLRFARARAAARRAIQGALPGLPADLAPLARGLARALGEAGA